MPWPLWIRCVAQMEGPETFPGSKNEASSRGCICAQGGIEEALNDEVAANAGASDGNDSDVTGWTYI